MTPPVRRIRDWARGAEVLIIHASIPMNVTIHDYMPGTGIFCGVCGHRMDINMMSKPADYFEPARRRCMTCEKICIGPEDPSGEQVEEARRDAARDRALSRATFEMIGDEQLLWQCKVCEGTVRSWDEATKQHLDVHGPSPIEEWWSP